MNYSVKDDTALNQASDCLVIGVQEGQRITGLLKQADQQSGGYLRKALKTGELSASNPLLLLHDIPGLKAKRVLLVHAGDSDKLNSLAFRKLAQQAAAQLAKLPVQTVLQGLADLPAKGLNFQQRIEQLIFATGQTSYSYTQTKSEKPAKTPRRKMIFIAGTATQQRDAKSAIAHAGAVVKGMHFTKDLGNLPANICTPTYLAQQGRKLAREYSSIRTTVLDDKKMRELGMDLLLSVGAGSKEPSKLICMHYNGSRKKSAPVVLVGKGVTFDTGGISLKPPANMDEMKFDMCGAASVFGTMRALAEAKLPMNVIGVVGSAENFPGQMATRPGDVVTSLSGKTVEILNTDAEGRLVLADALTYCERFKPAVVINVATLTGMMLMTLGKVASGIFSNDDKLASDLVKASEYSQDRAWHFPMWPEYQDDLKSNFADIPNIGNQRFAGSITAACFLSRFTEKFTWAHLDIAGAAYLSGSEKGATGRPVPMLMQYLRQYSQGA